MSPQSAAIVIPCFNHAHFLKRAIESAFVQTVRASEIVVVDDGSTDDIASVLRHYPEVELIRQPQRGLASARNTGLRAVRSDKVIFLDADDELLPNAIATGLQCFSRNADAAFVYGGYFLVRRGNERKRVRLESSYCDLLRCNSIGNPGTVMFDRQRLLAIGGFDETLKMCEDWDAYLRAARAYPFTSHGEMVARYHWHGSNMSRDRKQLGRWLRIVWQKQAALGLTPLQMAAWRDGESFVRQMSRGVLTRIASRFARGIMSLLPTLRPR